MLVCYRQIGFVFEKRTVCFDVVKMDLIKKWSFRILIIIILSLVKESHTACKIGDEGRNSSLHAIGTDLYLQCECDDYTKSVKWIGPDGLLIEQEKLGRDKKVYTALPRPGVISLHMNDLTVKIGGKYKCVFVESNQQEVTLSHDIVVFKPLAWSNITVSEQYITEGQDSIVFCSAEGYEKPYIWWYKDYDSELDNVAKYEAKEEGLLIKKATKEDTGVYRCVAQSPPTGEEKELIIAVELRSAPNTMNLTASPDVVREGETLLLECNADGNPLPTYSWRKILSMTTSPEETASWHQNLGRLIIPSVSINDHGTYECTAHNGVGIEAKENITITVLVAPTIVEFKDVTAEEGSTVSIICEAIGSPRPGIDVIGHRTNKSQTNYVINQDKPLRTTIIVTFEKLHRDHDGEYGCNVSNSVGSDEASMYLMVLYKPSFQVPNETIWTWGDMPVNLTCDHDSQPTAAVEWKFLGDENVGSYTKDVITKEKLYSLRAMLVEEDANYVTITPYEKYYYGKYECVAKNNLGRATKTFFLKEGFTPGKITLDQVNITDLAATSVTFEIQYTPSSEIPPIIGYTAEYDVKDNYNITDIHTNRTWAFNVPYKIDKLEPLTEYRIRFAAVNQVGTGPYGESLNFTTPDKSTPEPPSWTEHSGPILISNENKILKLISPEHNGDPIDYFAIKYCREDNPNECIEQRVPPTTELKLDHLSPNTSYTVEMVAHNSVGNSTAVSLQIILEEDPTEDYLLTSEAIIGIAVIVVILCIIILDVILFFTVKKGMIATCVHTKNKKMDASKLLRDKKGLLKDNETSTNPLKRPDKEHKEFQYNKSTGIITGKHSAV